MIKRASVLMVAIAAGCYGGIDSGEGDALELEYGDDTQETIENLKEAGFPDEEIGVLEDGTVIVGQDAVVSLEASREMIIVEDGARGRFRQYRTNNLVSAAVNTVCIDGSSFGGTLSTALNGAIANYNELNLSFDMVRTNGSNAGCDAEITMNVTGGGGGSAGFPSGGLPFGTVNIGASVANNGVSVARHVIMHELGHCIGFRHSDYFDRSISCGSGGNEGQAGVGAIQIPGTPAGAVINGSVMNACFNGGSSGEWENTDVIALNALYGGGGGDGGGDGGGGPSCEGRCGQFNQAEACQCDDQCEQFGDCCDDKAALCDDEPPPPPPPQPGPTSCVGQCGGNAGQCWCDNQCAQFGDCCDNKVEICG